MKSLSLCLLLLLSVFSGFSHAQATIDLTEYELVFGDEFDSPTPGTVVDPNKWSTRFYWGPYVSINNEEQLYVDTLGLNSSFPYSPFSIDNGILTIEAVPTTSALQAPAQPDANDPLWASSPDLSHQSDYSPNDVEYLSGLLNTVESYNTTHGYFEARLKFPEGQGLWPAFWLLNTKYVENSPEIDIVEFLGHKTNTVHHTLHYIDQANGWQTVSSPTYETQGPNYTEDFHTYGLAWDPTKIRFYVDGELVREVTDSEFLISSQSMYIILNLAVGGNWPGSPDSSTSFPAKFEIDYVRAYERKSIPTITQQVLNNEYQLMFSDEFNGTSLNPDVWNSAFLWGPYLQINNEEQVYIDKLGLHQNNSVNPFEVSSGTLKIKAEPIAVEDLPAMPSVSDNVWQDYPSYQRQTNYLENDGWEPKYSSGILTSYDSFKFVNGYAEARIKMPTGSGIWPAFWLLNGYYVGPSPEMDIVEVRGSEPNKTHHSYHYQNSIGLLQSSAEIYNLPGADVDEFHTYGFQWDSERMVWYVDGVAVREYVGPEVSTQLSYVLLNLAVGGNFVEDVGSNVTPAELEIDWVRVWQLDETADLVEAPTHDFELAVGEIEQGEYGWKWGTRKNLENVTFAFDGVDSDITLNVAGFDIDFSDEVSVFLNGTFIGNLSKGSDNNLNSGDEFLILKSEQQQSNVVEFRQSKTLGFRWGVTNVSLNLGPPSPSYTSIIEAELEVGVEVNGEYGWKWGGRANLESVFFGFENAETDLTLKVTGFDIDFANEVSVFLNSVQIGNLSVGPNNELNLGDEFFIPVSDLQSDNLIEFRQTRTLGFRWGVTNISIEPGVPVISDQPNYDAEINLGETHNGEYGWKWGSRMNRESVFVEFEGSGTNLMLSVTGFDVDFDDEISVFFNGSLIGTLTEGPNNELNSGDVFLLENTVQQSNVIEFRQTRFLGFRWGVTDINIDF